MRWVQAFSHNASCYFAGSKVQLIGSPEGSVPMGPTPPAVVIGGSSHKSIFRLTGYTSVYTQVFLASSALMVIGTCSFGPLVPGISTSSPETVGG